MFTNSPNEISSFLTEPNLTFSNNSSKSHSISKMTFVISGILAVVLPSMSKKYLTSPTKINSKSSFKINQMTSPIAKTAVRKIWANTQAENIPQAKRNCLIQSFTLMTSSCSCLKLTSQKPTGILESFFSLTKKKPSF